MQESILSQVLQDRAFSNYNNANNVSDINRKCHPQVDISDDENSLDPPKLSNFGSALLTDKENETPTYLRRSGNSLDCMNMKLRTLTGTQFTEDGTHSTLFTSVSKQQPSMTTVQQEQGGSMDDGVNSHKFQLIQQSMKDELLCRQSMRRSRRFIVSRLSTLGPAKRNSTLTTNLEFSSNISHDDSRDTSQHDPNIFSSSNNNSGILQGNDYNVFLDNDSHMGLFSKSNDGNIRSSTAATTSSSPIEHKNLSFGDLNPYQYLKAHKLPASELPNISRFYFEMQKRENRRTAVRKNIFTKSITAAKEDNDSNRANINASSKVSQLLPSKPERQPRRKPNDASVSSFSKIQSSPITMPSAQTNTNQKCLTNKSVTSMEQHGAKKREALGILDINSNLQNPETIKKHKPNDNQECNENPPEYHVVKKVEIVEPTRDPLTLSSKSNIEGYQSQRKRQVIQVNGTEYEKVELLGKGGSSKVYKVRSTGNKVYALKRVSFDEFDDSSVNGFKGEIELLKRLENQIRVVKLIDHEMDHGVLYVVMECGDNDLSQVLAQRSGISLDLEFVRYHAQEMLKCVKVVHDAGIVHSDLKPANFVFVKGILKIIDFGIANAVPDHTVNIYRDTQIGTPNYMAPEALVAMNYTQNQSEMQDEHHQNKWKVGKPSDIWSCGCIIYQMIYGRPPYGGFQGQNRLLAIMNPEVKIMYPDRTSTGDSVPRTALDTIKSCLERNPDKRCTVDELLMGPFIKPISVTHFFIRDLIRNAVKYGSDQPYVSKKKVESLADDVWNRLSDFRL